MFWTFVFILSGVALVTLTLAKRFEQKGFGRLFVLKAVSKGDERARTYYQKSLHFYSEGKHRFIFFVKKQLPVKMRMHLTKAFVWVKEKGESRFGNIRNSRLIKKADGMSEFFKTVSEIEKGVGEIQEPLLHGEIHEPTEIGTKVETVDVTVEPAPNPEVHPEPVINTDIKVRKTRSMKVPKESHEPAPKPRRPRARKVKIEEKE